MYRLSLVYFPFTPPWLLGYSPLYGNPGPWIHDRLGFCLQRFVHPVHYGGGAILCGGQLYLVSVR